MNVLIAEDDPTSRRILEAMLGKWGYGVVTAEDGNEALAALAAEGAPPIAILDRIMPGVDGADVCRKVRVVEAGAGRYTYLILLTVKDSKEDIVSGMEAGADDYITKPYDEQELRVRLSAGRRIIELHKELTAAKNNLLEQSRTDPLTGIRNRRAMLSELTSEMSRCLLEDSVLSVAILDIDFFKTVNDTYGHAAGDAVIRECAQRIGEALRCDNYGRIGGEEFLIVLPGACQRTLPLICGRILAAINSNRVVFEGNAINVTASIGAAAWDGLESMDLLLARSDRALYQAKGNGRNCLEISNSDDALCAL
jgi:two-component system cell cycle response regulator